METESRPIGGIKRIVFDLDTALALLTHYSDGAVPLDADVRGLGVSKLLGRYIGFKVASAQWRDADLPLDPSGMLPPLDIRWEGDKVLKWSERGSPVTWEETPDALKRS